eukprot:6193974-Pleurochrysis_carterae.AAC.1
MLYWRACNLAVSRNRVRFNEAAKLRLQEAGCIHRDSITKQAHDHLLDLVWNVTTYAWHSKPLSRKGQPRPSNARPYINWHTMTVDSKRTPCAPPTWNDAENTMRTFRR